MPEPKGKKAVSESSLWKKILAVQAEAGPATRDTEASIGGSKKRVVSIESVLKVYVPLCQKHGIVVVPVSSEIIEQGVVETTGKYGKKLLRNILVHCKYRVVDVDSGDSHEFSVISHGQDDQDKATGKLLTYALKYAYKQLFSSQSAEDDPDNNGHADGYDDSERNEGKQDAKPKKDDEESRKKQLALYTTATEAIKTKYSTKQAAEEMFVPRWKTEYKPFVSDVIEKTKGLSAEAEKHVLDFARYWWHNLDLCGNSDIAKAEKNLAAARESMSAANVKLLDKMLAKRKEAAQEDREREPGDDPVE